METKKLSTSLEDMLTAGKIIREGGLVAFPTETVYGLGANALDPDAVRSVYTAKGRPSDNPMIVHIADARELEPLIRGGRASVSIDALKVIGKFWPGPLTLVFPKSDLVPDVTTGGLDTVAIRMPSNETARRLIAAADRPIAAPSANISGRPSPTTAGDVLEDMDGRIDAVIMGEQCDVGIESTVLDLTGEVPVILRPGIITKEWLTSVIGKEVEYDKSLFEKPSSIADPQETAAHEQDPDRGEDDGFKPRSPGMKYRHYSPKARVILINGNEGEFRAKATTIGLGAVQQGFRPSVLDYGDDPRKAAYRLFADLRELDRQGYDVVLIRTLEESGFGFSVMNRMLKSAGYEVVE